MFAAVPLILFAEGPAVPALPEKPAEAEAQTPEMPPFLPAVPVEKAPPAPWLGLRVGKPDETTTAHLPSLPPGIGFVIRSVDEDGPAAKAGIQALDVLWKFSDQMLVNEGQLATLLSHHKPGAEVAVSLFRSGKPLEMKVTLGEAPERRGRFSRDLVDAAILPGDGGPMKVVNVGARTASFTTDEGRAWIQREGEGYKVALHDPKGKVIFEGTMDDEDDLDEVPKDWRRRVCALRRGLDHALEERMVPVRPPRPRVVPPSPAIE